MKYPPLKPPLAVSKKKVLKDFYVSTIEAFLAGSERVKGRASKTKWKQRSLSGSHVFYGVTLYIYIYTQVSMIVQQCSLALNDATDGPVPYMLLRFFNT